jgi:hypothetical protein
MQKIYLKLPVKYLTIFVELTHHRKLSTTQNKENLKQKQKNNICLYIQSTLAAK